ncbi:MAG: FecR domain-containing protein [Phycisphaerae bacterium]|nr:FecR domain-containing protein [Phycisphaerae bacterium]
MSRRARIGGGGGPGSTSRLAWAGAVAGAAGVAGPISAAWAQDAAAAPASQPGIAAQPVPAPAQEAPATPTKITVKAVAGRVAHRTGDSGDYIPAKAGDVLTEGTSIMTGVKSQVQVQVGTGQVLTIDRMGKVLLREALATQGKEKTTVDLPYGRVRFDVSSATVANDVKIQAPDSTLAVKGTLGLMEVAAGFPTLSYGDAGNDGRFAVAYPEKGVEVSVANQESTDSSTTDVAQHANKPLYVEILDERFREGDEFGFVYDFSTIFSIVFNGINAPGIGIVPPATGLFAIDEDTGKLIQYDINDPLNSILLSATTNAGTATYTGAATRPSSLPGGGTQFLRLLSETGGATLLGLDLGRGFTNFSTLATFNAPGGQFEGLGSLDGLIFSTLRQSGQSRVVRLDTQSQSIVPIADFGITLEGGVSALTARGTLLIPGRLPPGTAGSFPGLLGPDAVILEYDPRTNYIRSAFSDLTGDFTPEPFDSVIDFSIDPEFVSVTNHRIVGVGRFSIVLGGGVGVGQEGFTFIVNYTADVDGTPTTISTVINGEATRSFGDPIVLLATPTGRSLRDVSGETTAATGASIPLAPAPMMIDTSLPQLFRELAYSQQALNSGVVSVLVTQQILASAQDPVGCAQSGALGALPSHLANHVNRRFGVGAAVAEFRNTLSPSHPCLPPP